MLVRLVNGQRGVWKPPVLEPLRVQVHHRFTNDEIVDRTLDGEERRSLQECGSFDLEIPVWASGHPLSLLITPLGDSGYRSVWKYPLRATDITTICMMIKDENAPVFRDLEAILPISRAESPFLSSLFERHPELVPRRGGKMSRLDQTRLCSALNIEAKLEGTFGRKNVVSEIEEAKEDRVICALELYEEEIDNATTVFARVPSFINSVSHPGFPISFKEKVPEGSLQISLTKDWRRADIDIDLLTGFGHILGEVPRNKITDRKTNPQRVYRQLFDQDIRPLYTLKSETGESP